MIFLENSYVLKFDLKGNLVQINKLPSRIDSKPIFLESKMFFLFKSIFPSPIEMVL